MANDGPPVDEVGDDLRNRGPVNIIERVSVAGCLALTVLILLRFFYYSNYGFDFTDEGFYLNWISRPWDYTVSGSQFGYLYHYLYLLVNENIAALRVANVLLTLTLAVVLTHMMFADYFGAMKLSTLHIIAIVLSISSAVMHLSQSWLVTPNYNSLTLQGLLLVAIGVAALLRSSTIYKEGFGCTLIGFGGWLVFMAKPSSASLLAIVVLTFMLISSKCSLWHILIAAVVASLLLVLSAFFLDGGTSVFADRLTKAFNNAVVLNSGHSIVGSFRLDYPKAISLVVFLYIPIAFSQIIYIVANIKHKIAVTVIFFLVSSSILLVWFDSLTPTVASSLGRSRKSLFIIPVLTAVIAICTKLAFEKGLKIRRYVTAEMFFFSSFPYIYVFGTNNNYWHASAPASIFIILALLKILISLIPRHSAVFVLLVVGITVQIVSALALNFGIYFPHRQPQSLALNTMSIPVGVAGSELKMAAHSAAYISNARVELLRAGFTQSTGVLDLTGQSPGLLFAVGAKSIAQPWLVGGYKGSDLLAIEALRDVSCSDLRRSWVLTEPEGWRRISVHVLRASGINFPDNYELIASWAVPVEIAGKKSRGIQNLYRPIDPESTLPCQL